MIELKGVNKRYGHVQVIHDVDIAVADGEFTVFVGPSGCGKSTLLRMIAGLETIDGGDLVLNGKRINDVPPDQRGIAMVFQSYALYPHMTVAQNIGFSLDLKKVPKAEISREVGRVAELLQLSELLDRRPAALSGGQRQRVAIGRAIIKRPRVILFDEPLSNLDAALRVQMRAELQKLHQELKPTIVYVTHDQVEAMTMASRIVVLNQGRVEQWDTPIALYSNPVNTFVAGFIGSPKMNLLSGTLGADGDVTSFRADAGWSVPLPGRSLAGKIGERVTLGIRPEEIRPVDDAGKADFAATVAIVERLGAETYLNVTSGDATLLVRVQGDLAMSPGEPVQLAMNHDAFHLFDQSGRVIAA
ncbi:sn-glycerol-3-phosphate ABC transporter ATP-binding protein UgpC [Devosia sp.]|uniref:ABC transporter ATP-binding protein n=1 Tax=Devosia sp. TaxID=1871048 RepID=UPI002631153C|nr:sn-glycerol-3-phosphate ABC transporter ATP-binding protein UgpC [Devosia sp.]